jgi:hypothetical protein
MRFMVIVKSVGTSGGDCAAGAHESDFEAAMQKYNNELTNAGVLLALEGLRPITEGVRRRAITGKWKSVDGPFAETKEVVGGYWLWQVKSREEAIAWLERCPIPANGNTEIELREVVDAEQFAGKLAPAFVERTRRAAA